MSYTVSRAGTRPPCASLFPCRTCSIACAFVATTLLATHAAAQHHLLVGVDDPGEAIWAVDTQTNAVVPVVQGMGANAMAVDPATTTVFIMPNTVTLYKWNYSTPLVPPVLVGNTQTPGGANISLTGLAFDTTAGKLYASRDLNSSGGPEGFYEINTTTGVTSLVFSTPNASYRFGGFDYDVTNNKFYVLSDEGTVGLHEVNMTGGSLTFLAPYPANVTTVDLDGMAIGNGRAFMVQDRAVQIGGKIHVFNLTTLQYETPLQTPWFFNEIFSGATFVPGLGDFISQVPEPASAGALGALMGFASLRRWRRRAVAGAVSGAAAVTVLAAAGTAQAQLVLANDDDPTYVVNLNTMHVSNQFPVPINVADATAVGTGLSPWGMTADDPNRNIYYVEVGLAPGGFQSSTNLWRMSYDSLGSPQFVGIVRNSASGFEQSFQGLALDTTNGKMYGLHNIGGTPGEGIYEIDYLNPSGGGTPSIFASPALLFRDLPQGESGFNVQGLDYDPVTGKIYGINTTGGVTGRGIYSFDVNADAATRLVDIPTYRRIENDFDGLATGGGKAYLTTDEPGVVYIYDLVANNGLYTDFLSPILSDGLFGGAAYAPGLIPEPASLSMLVALVAVARCSGRR